MKRGTGKPLKHKSTTERKSHLAGNGNSQPGNSLDVRRSMLDVRCSRVLRDGQPVQVLESAVATRCKSQAELSGLGKRLADKSARLATLEKTGDLNDPAVLTELVHLQISIGLLPRRIAVKEECDANAERALNQATNHFIREHLGPRVRRLADRTRAIVERELSLHFRDAAALIVAVCQSERLRYIESLSWTVTEQPQRGALAHAQGALHSWAAVDKFENTYLAEKPINPNPHHNR
jgi:hypothetical protein